VPARWKGLSYSDRHKPLLRGGPERRESGCVAGKGEEVSQKRRRTCSGTDNRRGSWVQDDHKGRLNSGDGEGLARDRTKKTGNPKCPEKKKNWSPLRADRSYESAKVGETQKGKGELLESEEPPEGKKSRLGEPRPRVCYSVAPKGKGGGTAT